MKVMSESVFNAIINFIDDYYFANNSVPTMQEIADAIKLNKSNVCRNLQEMKERGLIDMSGGWRGVKTEKMSKTLSDIIRVPVVGTVACGTPMLAEQNIENYIPISSSILGAGKFFALHAHGNSMINANINDGDFVIVKQQNTADEGQIVVALIDDSTTLKRFYIDKKKHKIRLHPENVEMEDMFFDKVDIQGVVKKVLKDVK
jgi:repressor LexA